MSEHNKSTYSELSIDDLRVMLENDNNELASILKQIGASRAIYLQNIDRYNLVLQILENKRRLILERIDIISAKLAEIVLSEK
ncbi:MAG: hypothetical protein MUF85_02450 [Patescibacteria group bacterium]|jgi:hypothetical protein|nr:hypothetical protein [Patescibacteria group bacterium]